MLLRFGGLTSICFSLSYWFLNNLLRLFKSLFVTFNPFETLVTGAALLTQTYYLIAEPKRSGILPPLRLTVFCKKTFQVLFQNIFTTVEVFQTVEISIHDGGNVLKHIIFHLSPIFWTIMP